MRSFKNLLSARYEQLIEILTKKNLPNELVRFVLPFTLLLLKYLVSVKINIMKVYRKLNTRIHR